MVAATVGDRCANCSAVLASDQRYCIECGQRRGRSRFPLASGSEATVSAPPQGASVAAEAPRWRSSSGATLIAGIATLVLAMGVGVVIGRTNNNGANPSQRAAAPTVIVNGGGNSGAGATNGVSAIHHSKPVKVKKSESLRAKKAAAASRPTTQAIQKASNAASSVLGSKVKQAPTVTSGQSCAAGSAGCTNGHFSGTFFGP